MKIHCPVCRMAYIIPEEKFSRPVIKAICKKCSTKMIIDRDSKTVQTTSETESQIPRQATHQEFSSEFRKNASSGPPASEKCNQGGSCSPPLCRPASALRTLRDRHGALKTHLTESLS